MFSGVIRIYEHCPRPTGHTRRPNTVFAAWRTSGGTARRTRRNRWSPAARTICPAAVRCLAAACLAGAAPAALAGPQLHLPLTRIDLGRVDEGRIAHAVFPVDNRGDSALQIVDVRPSCTCARVRAEQRIVLPGGTTYLTVDYITTGRHGPQTAAITIKTNDPQRPRAQLLLTLEVSSVYEIQPLGRLVLSPVRPGAVAPERLRLLPREARAAIEDLAATVAPPVFEVEQHPIEQDGRRGVEFSFRLSPAMRRVEPVRASLTLRFRVGERAKTLRIPIRGSVLGDYQIDPPLLANPLPLWPGQMVGQTTLTLLSDRPVEILFAEARGPIRVEVQRHRRERTITLAVWLRDDAPAGPFAGQVAALTTSPAQPYIETPVFGIVRPHVSAQPRAVYLTLHDPAGQRARVRLQGQRGERLEVTAIEVDNPAVTAAVVTGENDGPHEATVEITLLGSVEPGAPETAAQSTSAPAERTAPEAPQSNAQQAAGGDRGEEHALPAARVRIHTNNAAQPVIEIPVYLGP